MCLHGRKRPERWGSQGGESWSLCAGLGGERETNVTRWRLGFWTETQELPEIEPDFYIFYHCNLGGLDDSLTGNVISLLSSRRVSLLLDSADTSFSTRCWESTFNLNDYLLCLFTAHKFLWLLAPDLGFDLQHLR